MVRKTRVHVDACHCGELGDTWRGHLIVNAPAYVFGPGLPAIAPPGVLLGTGVELPENIHKTDFIDDARQPCALLGKKS